MATEDQEKFLFNKLESSVKKYKYESKHLKHWTFGLRITLLLLAATSTILLGWSPENSANYAIWSRNVALAIGAISTFILGVSSFWNVEAYWLKQKVMFARVRALQEKGLYLKSKSELTAEEIEAIFNEYRLMMNDRIDYWDELASKSTPNKKIKQDK
jgi:coproporphyrinogen III oxidase-like Fe-S oxidoreductase